MYLPAIKPVWSLLINVGRTFLILFAITPDPILYTVFNNEIGRQIFRKCLDLSPFGKHVIIPCFCVTDKLPKLYP